MAPATSEMQVTQTAVNTSVLPSKVSRKRGRKEFEAGYEQSTTAIKKSMKQMLNEAKNADLIEDGHCMTEFFDLIVPNHCKFAPIQRGLHGHILQLEQCLYGMFLEQANHEYPLKLSYNDNKARHVVVKCDCGDRDCKKCVSILRNQKSWQSRHKSQMDHRYNNLRILFMQERIARITFLESVMKIELYKQLLKYQRKLVKRLKRHLPAEERE